MPGAGKLSDIAKVPLLMKESPVKVREIWLERRIESRSKGALTHVAQVPRESDGRGRGERSN